MQLTADCRSFFSPDEPEAVKGTDACHSAISGGNQEPSVPLYPVGEGAGGDSWGQLFRNRVF
ncbi:MAG: hypothetical protein BHV82_16570 [Odoribacter sp. 43_10]|nr:MAG: hypothetical protein BHV82_16570 [Odoribacter sp. 43_10]